MRILVTGGAGFLGSHVCELFKSKGWEVLAYDNLTKFEYSRAFKKVEAIRDYNLKFLESIGIPTIIDDIENIKMLRKAMNDCDFVAHCAAQPAMTVAIEDPILDFQTNIMGTLGILELCRERGTPVANCSTIHMYGNESWNSLVKPKGTRLVPPGILGEEFAVNEENLLLQGRVSPLHVSKRAAELYVQAYIDMYGLKAVNFRLTGIYGPRQFGGEDHGWVANFTIRTLLEQGIKIFGTDQQVRDILYVKDAANAFWCWFKAGCPSGTYNIGGGHACSTSICELLDMLEQFTGKKSETELLPKRLGDLWWFISDYSKATKAFNWKPTISPEVGVKRLIKWVEQERGLFE